MTKSTTPSPSYRVGVDIGGTFTDLIIVDPQTHFAIGKVLTTPADPSAAVEAVLLDTLTPNGMTTGQIQHMIHGATLVTNARPERRSDRLPRLQFSAGATHFNRASHRNRAAPAR